MIAIDEILVSDDVVEKQFVCNLSACKGVCCIQGESGAPLQDEEMSYIEDHYEAIAPFLTDTGRAIVAEKGHYVIDEETGQFKTPLEGDEGACAYVTIENGITKCGIEKAYEAGAITFQKPVSCHLYPIRVSEYDGFQAVNYEKWEICSDACVLGKELQVPVYVFLKDALIRKYGEEFYNTLDAVAKHLGENSRQ